MLSSNDFSAYVCANALNCQADGVPVLTRRDQLKKKELAAEERKQSQEARKANAKAKAKSKGKACDKGEEDNEDPPKEDPPARSRKRRSSVEKPDGDAAVKAEPKKRVPRAKAKSEAKPVSEAPEPSGSEPVPKPKARGRPKAKAAAEATAAAEKEPEEGDKVQNEIAEKSMEAKQAPKRAPKRASKKKQRQPNLRRKRRSILQRRSSSSPTMKLRILSICALTPSLGSQSLFPRSMRLTSQRSGNAPGQRKLTLLLLPPRLSPMMTSLPRNPRRSQQRRERTMWSSALLPRKRPSAERRMRRTP